MSGMALWTALWLLLGGCQSQKPTQGGDAGRAEKPSWDEPGIHMDAGTDADGAEDPDDDTLTGIIDTKDAVARAVGRARKGGDISLARQAASNRARRNLTKLLKDRGVKIDPRGGLHNVTIERIWMRGRYVYALAIMPLVDTPGADARVNDPASAPSNPPEDSEPKEPSSLKGGELP